jgi:hypothetical protein
MIAVAVSVAREVKLMLAWTKYRVAKSVRLGSIKWVAARSGVVGAVNGGVSPRDLQVLAQTMPCGGTRKQGAFVLSRWPDEDDGG